MTDRVTRIRDLFLHPKPAYSYREAAELMDTSADDIREWIASGELEDVKTDAGFAIPWSEIVSFAVDFLSQAVVEEALGKDIYDVLPELIRLVDLEVRIPGIEVVTLERLAARDGMTVSDVLGRELRDLVSEHSEWLSREVPGFAEALAWPELPFVPRPARGQGPAGHGPAMCAELTVH